MLDVYIGDRLMADEVTWNGQTGSYKYWIYPWPFNFSIDEPRNHIFCKMVNDVWQPIYIGETGDRSKRFDGHHAMECIKSNGATHIHAHSSSDHDWTRRLEEADLINAHDPPCNKQ